MRPNRVGLGQDSTDSTDYTLTDFLPSSISADSTVLLWGGVALLFAFLLGGRIEPQRKVRETIREKKRSYYQQKLKELA